MGKFRSTFITVIVGAALGAVAMLWFLGYFNGEKIPHTITDDGDNLAIPTPSDIGEAPENISKLESAISDIDQTRRNAIVKAAERVAPAVVSLSVIQMIKERSSSPFGRDFWDFLFLPSNVLFGGVVLILISVSFLYRFRKGRRE